MSAGRENDLQAQCMEYLDGLGAYYTNTHGNAFERRGRPDLLICWHGRFIGCELKKGDGDHPTPLQLRHLRQIRENGGIGVWLTTLQELRHLLNSLDP